MISSDTALEFAHKEYLSRRALRRHHLSERERLIAEIIIDYSFALGRADAYIPKDGIFCQLTGISKGHVSEVLGALALAGVIRIDRRGGRFSFQPDTSQWKVRSRLRSEAHIRAADRVEAWLSEAARVEVEQLHLLRPPPDFDRLMDEESWSEAFQRDPIPVGPEYRDGSQGPTASRPGGDMDVAQLNARIAASLAQFPACPQVPEKGTPVPDSGTPHLNEHLDVSYSSHLNAASNCSVPDSGTRRKPGLERDLLAEIREICFSRGKEAGEEAMRVYGGWWRLRIRENAVAVREAISETKLRMRDPRLRSPKNPGGLLRDNYRRIVGEPQGKYRIIKES